MNITKYETILKAEPFRKNGDIDGIPIAISWKNPQGNNCLTLCPHCACIHQHSMPTGNIKDDHRISHCFVRDISGSYYLKLEQGAPPDEAIEASKIWRKIHINRDEKFFEIKEKTCVDELLEIENQKFNKKNIRG